MLGVNTACNYLHVLEWTSCTSRDEGIEKISTLALLVSGTVLLYSESPLEKFSVLKRKSEMREKKLKLHSPELIDQWNFQFEFEFWILPQAWFRIIIWTF